MTWLTLVNLVLKVVGGVLDHLRESRLIRAGVDAEQARERLAVVKNIQRARRAVDRARIDVSQLRDKYRRQ